jgi:hypothetical protein
LFVPAARVVVPAPLAPVVPPVAPLGALAALGGLSSFELKKRMRDAYEVYLDELFHGL